MYPWQFHLLSSSKIPGRRENALYKSPLKCLKRAFSFAKSGVICRVQKGLTICLLLVARKLCTAPQNTYGSLFYNCFPQEIWTMSEAETKFPIWSVQLICSGVGLVHSILGAYNTTLSGCATVSRTAGRLFCDAK